SGRAAPSGAVGGRPVARRAPVAAGPRTRRRARRRASSTRRAPSPFRRTRFAGTPRAPESEGQPPGSSSAADSPQSDRLVVDRLVLREPVLAGYRRVVELVRPVK